MNVEKSTVTKLVITGAKNLDPITVYAEDLGPRRGKIVIECYGQSWAAGWGGMGDRTIGQFFCSCDEHYLAKNLSTIQSTVVDGDSIKDGAKKEIIKERRKHNLDQDEARELWDELEYATVGDDGWSDPNLMQRIFGDEWWYRLPSKPNHEYEYLCRIIRAVQDAFNTMESKTDQLPVKETP